MRKIRIDIPIIVEGKYDVNKLSSIVDGQIIKTDGFSIFNSKENREYIRLLSKDKGVIVLTDSDGAGLVIRNHLSSFLPKDKIIHLYPPQIEGKERRKTKASKEGYLGVEGLSADIIRELLTPFEALGELPSKKNITKVDFYEDGLTGATDSAEKRNKLKKKLNLPQNISANALLDTLNLLYSYEEYKRLINESEKDQ